MSISSVDAAVKIAADSGQASQAREDAIAYLADHPTEAAISTLIDLMETNDAGVRWKAADALASLGKTALVPVLHALVDKGDSRWLLEGAYHVFHDNRSSEVARMTDGVCAAMKGQGAALATVTAAGELLVKLAGEAS